MRSRSQTTKSDGGTNRWRWMVLGFFCGVGVATLAWTLWMQAKRPHPATTTVPRQTIQTPPPGATSWPGELRRVHIELSPPRDYIRPESCLTTIAPWVLPGFTREDLVALLRDNLVPVDLQRAILSATDCGSGQGCVVRPTADILFSLEPMTRQTLYRLLGRFPDNPTKRAPFRLRESDWFRLANHEGLSHSAMAALERLVVHDGGFVLFWDSGALCQRLDDEDKVRFIRVVTHSESYLVKLIIRSDTDLEPILHYWTHGPRQKSLRTFLESAKPSGNAVVRVDLVHLLSPFLRALAYTYPLSGDPPRDCHWTTLNFFRDLPPDDRYLDPRIVREEFSTAFEPIERESARYGDVVAIVDDHGEVNHTAIFLAQDLVFSKNGNSVYSPWIVTTIAYLIQMYEKTSGGHPEFLRRREM